jgi:hypothetical protein
MRFPGLEVVEDLVLLAFEGRSLRFRGVSREAPESALELGNWLADIVAKDWIDLDVNAEDTLLGATTGETLDLAPCDSHDSNLPRVRDISYGPCGPLSAKRMAS